MARTLEFYFDFLSHNAYLAWTQLPDLARQFDLDIELKPVLFAGFLKAHGQLGPAEIPAKSLWMLRDVLRKAARLGVPINPPASHPFNPLLSLRVAAAADKQDQARLVDAFFTAAWVNRRDISDRAVVIDILTAAGIAADAQLDKASSPNVKAKIKENTDAVLARGAFGVPTMIIDDELFWGFDDWPHLSAYLAGDDPLTGVSLEDWLAVRPSVQRPR